MLNDGDLFEIFKRRPLHGQVFRYKGDPPFESAGYHVFIVVVYEECTNTLFMVNGTSSIEKRLDALFKQSIHTDSTTVKINAGKYDFNKAATPATAGDAMLVPCFSSYFELGTVE